MSIEFFKQLKYKYYVTLPLYMLTPGERLVLSKQTVNLLVAIMLMLLFKMPSFWFHFPCCLSAYFHTSPVT